MRVVALAARQRDFPDRTGAARLQTGKLTGLHKLTEDVKLSIRLRYYATGPALGLLLDALEGPSWKTRLITQNLTVQEALAEASGYRTQEEGLRRQAESTFVIAKLRSAADSGVAGLRAYRRASVRDRSAESAAGRARRPAAHALAAGVRGRRVSSHVQHAGRAGSECAEPASRRRGRFERDCDDGGAGRRADRITGRLPARDEGRGLSRRTGADG